MSRFGKFRYHSGTKYGATSVAEALSWAIIIDWDNDGIYEDNIGLRCQNLTTTRGRTNFMKPDGTGFEPMVDGKFVGTFDNRDRRYDPYYTSSPLYPNIHPGRKFKILVKDNSTDTTYPVMVGNIEDIRPIAGTVKRVTITGKERYDFLRYSYVNLDLWRSQYGYDLVQLILAETDWADGTSIEELGDLIPKDWWIDNRKGALANIQSIADASLSTCFIAADGTFKYYDLYRIHAAVLTLTDSDILLGSTIPQPWDNVRNSTLVFFRPRIYGPYDQEVWKLNEVLPISAGSSAEIYTQNTYQNFDAGCDNYVAPVTGTHYTANAAADGSGANMTSYLSITPETNQRALSRKYTLTNTHSTNTLYVTLFKVYARPCYCPTESSVLYTDPTSIAIHGPRALNFKNDNVQSRSWAMFLSDWFMDNMANPQADVMVQIRGKPSKQFLPDLFDKVSLNITDMDIGPEDYWTAYIQHEWKNAIGQDVLTTFRFEPIRQE